MLSDSPYYFGDMSLDTGFLSILHNIYLDRSGYDEAIVYEIENPFNNLEFEETTLDQNYDQGIPIALNTFRWNGFRFASCLRRM